MAAITIKIEIVFVRVVFMTVFMTVAVIVIVF
jgi:hypothetical protein